MGADNEIEMNEKKERRDGVLLFLEDELQPLKKNNRVQRYDLVEEYAKTRKNKSLFVPLMLAGCAAVVAAGSFFLIKYLKNSDREVSVNVEVFEDVNLRNLVDTVGRAQDKYDAAVKKNASLKGDLDSGLTEAKEKYDSDLYVVDSMKLEGPAAAQKKRQAKKLYTDTVSALHAKYDADIAASESEMASYKDQLTAFDNSKVKAAEEKNRALDSERELQQLERKKLSDNYESRVSTLQGNLSSLRESSVEDKKNAVKEVSDKYQAEIDALDPTLHDGAADAIIAAAPTYSAPSDVVSAGASQQAIGEAYGAAIAKAKSDYADYEYLQSAVEKIPQKHSIPLYVRAAHSIVSTLIKSLTAASAKRISVLYADNTALSAQIDTLNTSFSAVMSANKISAFVVSSDKDSVAVFVDQNIRKRIKPEGLPAEIKVKAGIIAGTVKADGTGFIFIPNTPEKGKKVPALSTIAPGTTVELVK